MNIVWKKYPENKPSKYVPNCIVLINKEKNDAGGYSYNEIETNVFWSPIDSQHDDSIWRFVDYYIDVEDLKKLPRNIGITGMSYPLCPKCKNNLALIAANNKLFKPFKCNNCGISFEKRELLSGWMEDTFLKNDFIENIWEIIILQIKKNQRESIKKALKRKEEAERCKWYCHKCENSFRCKKPDDFLEFDEDGTRHCFLGSQYPVDCWEPDSKKLT
jgi:hypothetical protein